MRWICEAGCGRTFRECEDAERHAETCDGVKIMTPEMLEKARAKGFKLTGAFVLVTRDAVVGEHLSAPRGFDGEVVEQKHAKASNVLRIRNKFGQERFASFADVQVIA